MEKLLHDPRLYAFLEQVDEDFAAEARAGHCPHCGAVIHRADYPRKPRGGPEWDRRFSFCCSRQGCRKRTTPPSVRYLGRRVYFGTLVVLVTAMLHGANPRRVLQLSEVLPIDRRTIQRWRQWWTQTFVQGRFWMAARARFARPMRESRMPLGLVETFGAHEVEGLVKLLTFLAPITTTPCRLAEVF